MKKTREMMDRISELETELKAKIAETPKLEQQLAAAYERGTDPGRAQRALSEHRDAVSGMVAALRGLDARLYETQKSERERLSGEIRKKAEDDFTKAMKAAAQSLKPLRKSLGEILDKSAVQELTTTIIESLKSSIWETIDAASQERFVSEVPCAPALPPERNDQGRIVTEQLAFPQVR